MAVGIGCAALKSVELSLQGSLCRRKLCVSWNLKFAGVSTIAVGGVKQQCGRFEVWPEAR